MCGLVGVAGDITMKHEKAFKNMLVLDVLRGEDSTGVASINKFKGADVSVAKAVGHPFNLFDTKRFDKLMSGAHRALIGHNRFATQGAVNAKNAHPFEFDGLVGVHNGTLVNKHVLDDAKDFSVDSENLYHSIDKNGLDATMKLVSGAWALVWWDKYEETLNFLRNEERPLHFCFSEDGNTFFWASEPWMLSVALSRNDIKRGNIVEFEENLHYKFEIGVGGKFDKPVVKRVEGKKPQVFPVVSRGKAGAGETNKSTQQSKGTTRFPASKYDSDYLSSRVTVEAMVVCQDNHGAEYVSCFDPAKPFYEVRLYVHHAHSVDQNIGCVLEGVISAYSPSSNTEGFYKISPTSVTITGTESVKEVVRLFKTSKGTEVTEAEWKQIHEACACCGEQITPLEGKHRFTTYDDVICGDCIANENELLQYVTLK